MSVNRELNLLKQPSNNRAVRVDDETVIYFRGNTLIRLNQDNSGVCFREIAYPASKSIKAIACRGHEGSQQVAIAFDTGTICVYDFATNSVSLAHNEHRTRGGQLGWIGLLFTEEGIVISVVDHVIVQYCSVSKKAKVFGDLLSRKFSATEMVAGPGTNANLLAIGSYCGLVVVVSLKDMTVKCSFRGHNYQITSIVWMRNIGDPPGTGSRVEDDEDCFDVYNDAHFRDDFGTVKSNAGGNGDPREYVEPPPPATTTNFDFAEACQSLKEDMLRSKRGGTPMRRTQPDRDECKKLELRNDSDGSLSSGELSNVSQASSTIENLFEKIDINDTGDDLSLVTLDQHMNVWVWDVRLNCAKGNFRIGTKSSSSSGRNKKPPTYHPAQFFLLGDNRTIVGNTCNAAYFSLQIHFDTLKNKLEFDFQVTETSSIVLCALKGKTFLAYFPYHSLRVVEYIHAKEMTVLRELPLYNGTGKTIAVSDVNPMRIAIGSHEICFFDLTTVTDNGCSFHTYYKNLKSAIVCLAWHPEKEILAFGTSEGRIGLYNSVNRSVDLLKPFAGVEIYDLAFAKIGDEFQLFAVSSNGSCVRYLNGFSEFKYIVQNIKDISALHVDDQMEKLFIGTKVGNVYQLDLHDAKLLSSCPEPQPIKVSKNYIRMFRSNCDHSRVVVASKNPEITVMEILKRDNSTPPVIKLKGHSQPIIWVDFSRTNPNLLLSASYDSTIRVWNLAEVAANPNDSAAIINVTSQSCFEFSVNLRYAIFSPLDENCIIVGNQWTPFYVFNMNEKTCDFPPKIVNLKPTAREKEAPLPSSTTIDNKSQMISQPSAKCEPKVVDAKKNETTVFYLAKRESTKKVLQCLLSMVSSGSENSDNDFLNRKIFSKDLAQVKSFLFEEVKNYKASNMKSLGNELACLMTGNVKESITEHIRDKSLTDEMVGISPMVSHHFWRLCSEAYAAQLIEDGQPLKAVIYLLGIHKVDDSLNILCIKNFYREAWVLAKMKKPEGDAIFTEIATKWIHNLDVCGDYESAAVVAAGIGNYQCALEQLMKRREEQLTEDHQAVIKSLRLLC